MMKKISATATMPSLASGRLDLVLGILPSASSIRDWHTGLVNRRAARRLWIAAAPPQVLTRFVLLPSDAVLLKNNMPLKPMRRRRLAGSYSLKEQEQRALAIRREAASGSNDLVHLRDTSQSVCTCAELTRAWFVHALSTWPHAKFYGKTEDDVLISLPALHWELLRLPGDRRHVWWGLMAWTGNGGIEHQRVGCWGGGFEDDPALDAEAKTLAKERACPLGAAPIAPSPTHEIDVRSSSLALAFAGCEYPRQWLAAMATSRRCPNDCAAVQGH